MSTQLVLDEANLPGYLERIGLFERFERIRVEKAGDGNINWVRRARSESRSFVIKQARPALERFPEYQAPTERIRVEARYYGRTRAFDHERVCPVIHGFQEADRVLVLEDLGSAPRMDEVLARDGLDPAPAEAIAAFLGRVHEGTRAPDWAPEFENEAMQRLHGEHIFVLPFRPNDFPLPPATRARAEEIWRDTALRDTAGHAYARYLHTRGALVHGDVQAGNVLLTENGPKLLDAEIAHIGDPAFDLGTLLAHLALPAVAAGQPRAAAANVEAAEGAYATAHGDGACAFEDVARYAGLEMLRRTLGAARVPAVETDDAGLRVVDRARRWVLDPPQDPAALLA